MPQRTVALFHRDRDCPQIPPHDRGGSSTNTPCSEESISTLEVLGLVICHETGGVLGDEGPHLGEGEGALDGPVVVLERGGGGGGGC